MGDINVLSSEAVTGPNGLMAEAMAATAPPPPAADGTITAEGAKQEIARLRTDKEWTRDYLAGNADKRNMMLKLQSAASPETVENATARPEQPSGYALPDVQKGETATPELTQFRSEVQAVLHAFAFPAGVGSAIAARVDQLAIKAAANPQTPQQSEQAERSGHAQLERAWGVDYSANLAAVRAEVARVATVHPKVTEWLQRSGASNDPFTAMHILNSLRSRAK